MVKNFNIKNKLLNKLMLDGKKKSCERILLKTLKNLQRHNTKDHAYLIKLSIMNVAPTLRLKEMTRRRHKAARYMPYVLKKKNRISDAIHAILKQLEKKRTVTETLKEELLKAAKNESGALSVRESSHKAALSKKKYMKFRWFK